MLGVFVGLSCFGWDSGKQLGMGFGENFGAFETLWAEESSFPKHEPS